MGLGLFGRGASDGQTAAKASRDASAAAVRAVRAGRTHRGASPIKATTAGARTRPAIPRNI